MRIIIAHVATTSANMGGIGMSERDHILIEAFTSMDESADRIACFKSVRRIFLDRLPPDIPREEEDYLVWRLLQLRKAGKLAPKQQEG
jgi:hypothetical protein